jgi:hypothetical protein
MLINFGLIIGIICRKGFIRVIDCRIYKVKLIEKKLTNLGLFSKKE